MRWLGCVALGVVLWCVTPADALADKRVALVIGNGVYTKAPRLPNPPRDAHDVAAALKRIDFDVIRGTDLDRAGMQDAIVRFARAAQSADVGLFYYSGHAMQFKGVNYLGIALSLNPTPRRGVHRFQTGRLHLNPKRTNDVLPKPDNLKSYRQWHCLDGDGPARKSKRGPHIFYNGPWPFRQCGLFPLGQRHVPFALRKLAPR